MQTFRSYGPGFWLRVLGLGILDAIVLALVPSLIEQGATVALVSMLAGAAGINYVYLSSRLTPGRWLAPGLVFMVLLLIWPIFFTVYIAMTNWSTGNFIEKSQAIERITSGTTYLIEGDEAPLTDLFIYRDPALADPADPTAALKLLVRTERGTIFFGTPSLATDPPAEPAALDDLATLTTVDENDDGIPETVEGYQLLRLVDVSIIRDVFDQLVLDIPDRGQARARTFSSAVLAIQRYSYDEARDALVDVTTGDTCPAAEGNFICQTEAGSRRIDPGWREFIGTENFTKIITDSSFRAPFLRIFTWNVIFAAAVVGIQLVLGLALAVALDDKRIRFRGFWRSVLIIPYAAPAFITVLVWRGLLNPGDFGPINQLIAAITFQDSVEIPWVAPRADWFWSRIAVILVTVWQGFAYFFLIATGALQSVPSELKEAAATDGANGPQVFRKITFPLLMVGIAPLLIASFAYNFNAFVNVFLLTQGGPPVSGYSVPFGETDILISFVFDLAVQGGRGGQFALAAAATFFIFFIVATMSAFSFRYSKRLENIYGNL